jgi:hypothetical protein
VFTHSTSDPFGTLDEVRDAAALIPAPTQIVEVTGARPNFEDLDVPALAVDAALRLLGRASFSNGHVCPSSLWQAGHIVCPPSSDDGVAVKLACRSEAGKLDMPAAQRHL